MTVLAVRGDAAQDWYTTETLAPNLPTRIVRYVRSALPNLADDAWYWTGGADGARLVFRSRSDAEAFETWREEHLQPMSPDGIAHQVLADPDTAPVPVPAALREAVCLAIPSFTEPKDFPKIVAYAERLPFPEAACLLREIGCRFPDVFSTPDFIEWAVRHQDALAALDPSWPDNAFSDD